MKKLLYILLGCVLIGMVGCNETSTSVYDSYSSDDLRVAGSLANTYDTSTPGGGDDPREADDRMREIKAAVQEIMNDHNGQTDEGDHYWPLTGTQVSNDDAGQHRMVSLRKLDDNETDENPINPDDLTSYSTASDLFFIYNKRVDTDGDGDVDATDLTELHFQDESGNVTQVTRSGLFTFSSAWLTGAFSTPTDDTGDDEYIGISGGGSGSTTRGAYLSMYGNDHASYPGSMYLVPGWLDETDTDDDDEDGYADGRAVIDLGGGRVSNAADPASDQDVATKAYVDGIVAFGTRVSVDTDSLALAITTIYQAECDGFLTVWTTASTAIKVFSDSSTSPTTELARDGDGDAGGGQGSYVCVPIRGDDYVQVTGGSTVTIYWLPMGTGGLEK